MSLIGKNTLSLRKKDVKEQKSIGVGFKKIVFAHKATLGDTGINLTALVTPSEMSSTGFVNPNSSELTDANLLFYRKNLTLISSSKGLLVDYLSYSVPSSSRISFNGFTAESDEIFIGVIDPSAKTELRAVDGAAICATDELAVGDTDFNVGQSFQINKYPLTQVGDVLVFRNGLQQFRNPGNGTSGGNYQEIAAGGGLGMVIRFNDAPVGVPDNIMVVSNGLSIERPDGSMMQTIENIAGQLDQVIPTVAALAGVPETNFQAAPNNIDLKQFGDQVLDHENRIDVLEETASLETSVAYPVSFGVSSQWIDAAFLDLTAGEWDITLHAVIDSSTAASATGYASLHDVAGNVVAGGLGDGYTQHTWTGGAGQQVQVSWTRIGIVVASTTRWYAKLQINALNGRYGLRMMARRVKKG